jgi:hypothetical protein
MRQNFMPYLTVTESRYDKGSGQRERSRLFLYPEDVQGFQKVFLAMIQSLMDLFEDGEPRRSRRAYSEEDELKPRRRTYGSKGRRYSRQQSFEDYEAEEGE